MSGHDRRPWRPGPRPRYLSQRDAAALFEELASVVGAADDGPGDTSVTGAILAAMVRIGIHPALIHAFRHTGTLVSEDNHDVWSRDELARWHAAVDSFAASRAGGT